MKQAKNTVFLWFDGDAEEAARFYAKTFPDSSVGASHRAPGDFPSGKEGDVLTVEFTLMGIPCIGLNGGPGVTHSDAFSFQIRNHRPGRNGPHRPSAKRVFDAMMTMKKIDIATVEAARRS